jgi:hypothetical protein
VITITERAVTAAAEAIDHEMRATIGMRGDTAFAYDAARVALAAAAPHLEPGVSQDELLAPQEGAS